MGQLVPWYIASGSVRHWLFCESSMNDNNNNNSDNGIHRRVEPPVFVLSDISASSWNAIAKLSDSKRLLL